MSDLKIIWLNFGVNAFMAAATFLAVIVALFGKAIRAKLFPPKLSLKLLDPQGEMTETEIDSKRFATRYYHLQVSNSRRWSPANQVQVVLLQIEEPDSNETLQIIWRGAVPLQWRHQRLYPIFRTIGAPADIDLCSVVKDKWLAIHPVITPFNLNVLKYIATKFVLLIQAQGSEVDSPVIRLKISWDGQWEDGALEMQKHLSITEPEDYSHKKKARRT